MKKRSKLAILIMGLTCINMAALLSLTTEVNTIKTDAPTLNHTEFTIQDSVEREDSIRQAFVDTFNVRFTDNFDYVFPKFQAFNTNIDTMTVHQFCWVMQNFNLDSTDYQREMYTGQILLESGAKQYRENGKLVVSAAGAIGICQIMPATCRGYMEKYMDSTDIVTMSYMCASDFSFVYDDKLSTSQKNKKCAEWLTSVNNNIAMWGFITRHNLDKKKDLHTQLVSYNMGSGGMKRYVSNGGNINTHKYINGIKTKIHVAN